MTVEPRHVSPRRPRISVGLPNPSEIDRLPPHSIEAEQAVLGCILLDQSALSGAAALLGRCEEFYDLRHQVIFDEMIKLSEERIPINLVTVVERLKSTNQLEAVGGVTYVAALPEATPTSGMVETFAQIVADRATERRIIQACAAVMAKVYETDGHSTESVLSEAEQAIMSVRRSGRAKSQPIKELVSAALEVIEQQFNRQGQIGGLATGFIDLDRAHDGLHSDELIVVSGFPGAGKTAFAMNILEHVALNVKQPVGIFSFEMSPVQLTTRIIASQARLNLRKTHSMTERDFFKIKDATLKIGSSSIHIEKASGMNIFQVRARARQMKMEHGIKLWLIDYTQIVGESGNKENNREREVANISRNLKQMAGEFGDPVLALSQLNDDGQLRESRAIGQDADSVWTLERGSASENETDVVPVKLIIKKQRNGPSPCTIDLTFLKCFTRFESAARISE